jgi:hypothetical protein
MVIEILRHTPVWVWLVLAAVAWLGFVQSRDRYVSRSRAGFLPWVFVLLSLCAVAFGPGELPVTLLLWGLGFAAAWVVGRRFVAVRGAAWSPERERVRIPGSWVPLLLMAALFSARYVFGVVAVLAPAMRADARFVALTSLSYGVFAGLFWARGRSLRAPEALRGPGAADARAAG